VLTTPSATILIATTSGKENEEFRLNTKTTRQDGIAKRAGRGAGMNGRSPPHSSLNLNNLDIYIHSQ